MALFSLQIDAEVENTHEYDGQKERQECRQYGNVLIGCKELDFALAGLDGALALDVGPGEDPRWPEKHGDEPGERDHQRGTTSRALGAVRQRPRH